MEDVTSNVCDDWFWILVPLPLEDTRRTVADRFLDATVNDDMKASNIIPRGHHVWHKDKR